MNQKVQKLLTALPISLKRFPFAWIGLLLYALCFLFGERIFHYGPNDFGEAIVHFFTLTFIVYPIYFLNIAFRLRSEAGRPVKLWIQASVYLAYIAWPFLFTLGSEALNVYLFFLLPIVDLIPVALVFILPFRNNPHLLNPWPFAKRMLFRFLIACLIAVLAYFLLTILLYYDPDRALTLIPYWKFLEFPPVISFMLLLPGLFLILIPVPERVPEAIPVGHTD